MAISLFVFSLWHQEVTSLSLLEKLKDKKPFGRPKFCHITIPLSKALEMQGKQVDAMVELSKICLLLRIFPPEES
ncbi:hypothetical protein AAZX31_11G204000 [Glycine max]